MSAAATRRCFLALRVPAELARELEGQARRCFAEGLRPYPARDLHVTLVFLGGLEPHELEATLAAYARAFEGLEAPRLELAGAGTFPPEGRPRVFWVGLAPPGAAALYELHRRARAARGEAPQSPERWTPHITLARAGRQAPEAFLSEARRTLAELQFVGEWVPREVVLFESRPQEPEARHRPLASWPLRA